MATVKNPSRDAVRKYCIVNDLFTCGNSTQYEKMFDLLDMQYPIHDIATIIWACSETEKHADEIENELRQLMHE